MPKNKKPTNTQTPNTTNWTTTEAGSNNQRTTSSSVTPKVITSSNSNWGPNSSNVKGKPVKTGTTNKPTNKGC